MPSWKIHLLFNSFFLPIFIKLFLSFDPNYSILLILIPFNILASVFPDIDSTKSKIRNAFAIIIALTAILYFFNIGIDSMIILFICFVAFYLFIRFFPTKHRGITHDVIFSIVFSLIATTIIWIIFAFSSTVFVVCFLIIFFGYASHMFLDKVV